MNLSREELLSKLRQIDEYEFEHLVADVWEQRGWETIVTTGSSDRGKDVIAEKNSAFKQKHVIQAKRYSAGNTVSGPDIRNYEALKRQESDVDAVVIITTSSFSTQAQQIANDLNVKLVDGEEMSDMILDLDSQTFLTDYFDMGESAYRDNSDVSSETTRDQIEAYLDEVDPYEFERFIADLWEKHDYSTEVTSGSQDRGIDIMAEKEQRVLIQAKTYSGQNKIGSEEVRKYATLYQQDDNADRVVLVTTSGFTSQAKELAQNLSVDAIDREDLVELIKETDMGVTDTESEAAQATETMEAESMPRETLDAESRGPGSTETVDDKYDTLGEPSDSDFVSGAVKVDDPTVLERQRLKSAYHELRRARGEAKKQEEKNQITEKMKEIEEKLRESK